MRTRLLLATFLLAGVAALTACGDRADSSGRTRITFLTMQLKPTFDDYFNNLIAEFEARHPGVVIDWKDMPYDNYETKLMMSLNSPAAPDVINIPSESIPTYVRSGFIQSFDELLPAEVFEQYLVNLLEDGGKHDGKVFALPWYAATSVTLINRDLLQKAGLSEGPRHIEDIPQFARAVREKTGKFGYYPLFTESASLRLYLNEAGVPLLDEDGRACFYTPRGVEVFKFWTDLYREKLVPAEALTAMHRHPIEQYKTGNLAVLVTGPQFLRQVRSDAPEIYEVTDVAPTIRWRENHRTIVSLHTLAVSQRSKSPQLAAEFAAFVTNAENQLDFAKLTVIVPSTRESLEDPYFADPEDTKEGLARRMSAQDVVNSTVYRPPSDAAKLYRVMEQVTEDVALGKITADDGLKRAQEQWNAILGK